MIKEKLEKKLRKEIVGKENMADRALQSAIK